MNMEIYLGIGFGLMALGSLGGVFSSRIRKWAWKKHPFSPLTSSLFFLLFAQASLLAFGVFDGHKIYTSIPVVTAILWAISMGKDYYLTERKTKK